MRAVAATVLLALAAAVAGCSGHANANASGKSAGAAAADFIVPGTWDVRGTTDYMFAWAHNAGAAPVTAPWSITAANGSLPAGWTFHFAPATSTLAANGTRANGGFPDWGTTLIALQVPANQTAATVNVVLHAGPIAQPERIVVAGARGGVAGPGSKVGLHYIGKFASSGATFDQGDFETTLGSGETVPGFDHGLMGLALGETQTLRVPPALAYGYSNPPGSGYEQFNGQTLLFTVTMSAIH